MMKLQILILTQRSRSEFLEQLLSVLEPQISTLGLRKFDQVDVFIHRDTWAPGVSLGEKREWMRQRSAGEYICFFDDDDLPAPNYISSILAVLDGEVDQIGFEVALYQNGRPGPRTFHTLKSGRWYSDALGHHRHISHICPMRRLLAMQRSMQPQNYGEDLTWAAAMTPLVKTETYVDRVLYHYLDRNPKNDLQDPFNPWRLQFVESLRPRKA
jgi:hypothetical protein